MRNKRKERLLIVYPYANIDSNPTMSLFLEQLSKRRIAADVLMIEHEIFHKPESYGEGIELRFLPESFFDTNKLPLRYHVKSVMGRFAKSGMNPKSLLENNILFGMFESGKYSAIIGIDNQGIRLADYLRRERNIPLVYMPFEIFFKDEAAGYEAKIVDEEIDICDRVGLAMLQDEERAEAFCTDRGFPIDKVVNVPVAPPDQAIVKSDFLRERLDIANDKRIVLMSGSLESWSCRDELEEMVSYWPDEFCLVIHSRSKLNPREISFCKRLEETGKIFLHNTPVARDRLTELIASADFGLASYKPTPENLFTWKNLIHVGLASGKTSFYALCGLPLLARSLPVYDIMFEKYNCGRTYEKLSETGKLLKEMNSYYDRFSANSRKFYEKELEPTKAVSVLIDRILEML